MIDPVRAVLLRLSGLALPPRVREHVVDLVRLAGPVITARTGIMVMALVDTIMVGRFATSELAYLTIGLVPFSVIFLVPLGLLLGTMLLTAFHFGREDVALCGATWRRSVPYALVLGVIGFAVTAIGDGLLLLTGQTEDLSAGGGEVLRILGLGLPFALFYVTTIFFLDGLRRPVPGMVMMLVANALNVLLNWVLVYGNWGFPALGAAGAAWATTVLRMLLAAAAGIYVWTMPDHDRFAVRRRAPGGWRDWTRQRRVGYAAGVGIGVEVAAFSVLGVFAGWLGHVPLGALAIGENLLSIVFMVALGFGIATSVRVGVAHGRGDHDELALAGWTGLGVATVAMTAAGVAFLALPATLAGFYSTDSVLLAATVPVVAVAGVVTVFDGGQVVMATALRGRGETWWPTGLVVIAYFGVMLPIAGIFAFVLDRGARGLMEAILVGSVVALALLAGRFHLLARRDRAIGLAPP